AEAHGSALGEEEVRLTKEALHWPAESSFYVPDEVLAHFRKAIDRGREMEAGWQARFDAYAAAFPEDAARLKRELAGELPQGGDAAIPAFAPSEPAIATRAASGRVINELAKILPNLIGGSADLAPSTNTLIKGADSFSASTPAGRNLHFGVRE